MKYLKDYLHFYIGQECIDQFNHKGVLVGIDEYSLLVKSSENGTLDEYSKNSTIKLLLRPLADMNEEEEKWIEDYCEKNPQPTPTYLNMAEVTSYLLKQGLDVFCLIDEGLALNKTKVK